MSVIVKLSTLFFIESFILDLKYIYKGEWVKEIIYIHEV
jgi:hypothetical protein